MHEARPAVWVSGWDRVKQAARRSRLTIAMAVAVGAVAMIVYGFVTGPLYEASSLSLLAKPAETQVNPERRSETQALIAQSPDFEALVAARLGTSREDVANRLESSIEPGADILHFRAHGASAQDAMALASTAEREFPSFLRKVGEPPARGLSAAREATRIRPAPVREGILGAAVGLVAGLLLMAVREALGTRVRSVDDVAEHLGWPVILDMTDRRLRDDVALERLALTLESGVTDAETDTRAVVVLGGDSTPAKAKISRRLAEVLARRAASVALATFDDSAKPEAAVSWLGRSAALNEKRGGGSVRVSTESMTHGASLRHALRAEAAQWLMVDAPPLSKSTLADRLSDEADWTLLLVVSGETTRAELADIARRSATWPTSNRGVILTDR
jgi:capsular polysaccharide biosynthesis protein